MAGEATPKALTFEEGWPFLQEAINKLIDILDGVRSDQFNSEEYMQIYTTALTTYALLILLVLNAKNYMTNTKRPLKIILHPRYCHIYEKRKTRIYTSSEEKKLPSLNATSLFIFYELIRREREGEQIDQALVKNVLDIYVEIGEGSMKYYVKDFEEAMLIDTASFCSHKASIWIASESYKDYMLKVEESLKHEKDRVSCYLQQKSQYKLLEVVEHELLSVYASQLEEKKMLDENEVA
ncbi:cullin family protein [Actinidia rufa]|uniref:Cullin family protein n=1 Tax=Actinidia rufa TaxID=165716 RepID=A0A7J0HFT7_9ERIC|nr:cullin family protein [Actinidia rufa]